MRKSKKYIMDFLIIVGLSVLFFGIIDLMSYWRDPIDKRPFSVNSKLASVVLIFSVIIFIMVDFFIPFYRRRLIKKLHQKFNDSTILEPLKLKIKVSEQLSIVFFAVDKITEQNEITFEYNGNAKDYFDKLIKEPSVIKALEGCRKAKSEFKKVYGFLTQLTLELNKNR